MTAAADMMAKQACGDDSARTADRASVRVCVAAHKEFWMPEDPLYLPVWVGATLHPEAALPYQSDAVGTNISAENGRYCELTALYWAWQNLDADYIGLAHYRRHFKGAGARHTLTLAEARALLQKAPIVVPRKRNYVIETLRSHYVHTHDQAHLDALEQVLSQRCPEYMDTYHQVLGRTWGYMFNMCIMRRDLLDAYCSWLFPLLRDTEKLIDFETMTPYNQRCMGRLAELLFNVWMEHVGTPAAECPVIYLGSVNWLKKGTSFLRAKFFGHKYDSSF